MPEILVLHPFTLRGPDGRRRDFGPGWHAVTDREAALPMVAQRSLRKKVRSAPQTDVQREAIPAEPVPLPKRRGRKPKGYYERQ